MNYKQGLTFVELLVVISIIGLISAITLANTGILSSNAKATAAANTIYDTMKKARHDSVAVRELNGNLFPSYGVEFNMSNPEKIIVYADCLINDKDDPSDVDPPIINQRDEFWNDTSINTCAGSGDADFVEEVLLPYNAKIKEIRSIAPAFPAAPPVTLDIPARNQTETEVYMEFVRPEPTIWITLGADGPLLKAGRVEIDVVDAAERSKKTIIFHSTGQFEIK